MAGVVLLRVLSRLQHDLDRLGQLVVAGRGLGLGEEVGQRVAVVVGTLEAVHGELAVGVDLQRAGDIAVIGGGLAVHAVAQLDEQERLVDVLAFQLELGARQRLLGAGRDLVHLDAEDVDLGLILFGAVAFATVRVVAVLQLGVVVDGVADHGVLVHGGGVLHVDLGVGADLLVVELQQEGDVMAVHVLGVEGLGVGVAFGQLGFRTGALDAVHGDVVVEGQALVHGIGDPVLLVDGVGRVGGDVGAQVEVDGFADGCGVGALIALVETGVDVVALTLFVDGLVHARLGALGHDVGVLHDPLLVDVLRQHVRADRTVHVHAVGGGVGTVVVGDFDVVAAEFQLVDGDAVAVVLGGAGDLGQQVAAAELVEELGDVAGGHVVFDAGGGFTFDVRQAFVLVGHDVALADVLWIVCLDPCGDRTVPGEFRGFRLVGVVVVVHVDDLVGLGGHVNGFTIFGKVADGDAAGGVPVQRVRGGCKAKAADRCCGGYGHCGDDAFLELFQHDVLLLFLGYRKYLRPCRIRHGQNLDCELGWFELIRVRRAAAGGSRTIREPPAQPSSAC